MGRCIIENPCFELDVSKVNLHVKRYKAAIKSLMLHYNRPSFNAHRRNAQPHTDVQEHYGM